MKKTFSKITAWIWRGAALLLAIYLLLAAVLDIPFFSTSVGLEVDSKPRIPHHAVALHYLEDGGDGPRGIETYHNVLAFDHTIKTRDFIGVLVGYNIDIQATLDHACVFAVAQNAHIDVGESSHIKSLYLNSDQVTIMGDFDALPTDFDWSNLEVVGLKPPRFVDENGVEMEYTSDSMHYIRSFSTAFLPQIDTGSSPLGMILLACIPVFIAFVIGFLPILSKMPPASHKKILRFGLCAKLLVVILVFAVLESPVLLFYSSPRALPNDLYALCTWLTPIISIPALAVWVASFKNKKFAPVVAAAIMVLCLYQPLANLICLFATVIAWGYFTHGVCRFFGRFRKAKAEAV